MPAKDDEIERRIELAAKVQVLEERTHHIVKAVDRIEEGLTQHVMDEEAAFHAFHKTKADMTQMISDFKDSIEDKLDQTVEKVEEKVNPIYDEFKKVKTVYKVLSVIGSAVLAILLFFKDAIAKHFGF